MAKDETSQSEQYSRLTDEERALLEKDKRKKRKWIKWGVFIGLILVGAISFYIFASGNSAKGQLKDFKEAVDDRDYKTLKAMMTSNDNKLTESDMKHFVDYVKKEENKKRYNENMNQIEKQLEDGDKYQSDVGELKDKNGHTILSVSKDGARFLFINQIAFEPKFYKVYVKGYDNQASYEFQNNGKSRKVVAPEKQDTELGEFMVGNYDIDATKKYTSKGSTVEGNLDGNIHIDTDDISKGKKIYGTEHFGEAWFKVEFENASELDNKNYNLNFDEGSVDFKKNKVYGKFPAESYITVSGTGQLSGEVIHTDEVQVEANKNNAPQIVKLKFKQDEIDKQKKRDKQIEKDAKSFLKDYTKRLNTGYKVDDFDSLKHDFEDDSSPVAKNIKQQVEKHKNEHDYTEPEFKSYKRSGDEITVVLSKKDKEHDDKLIQSQYTLKYDENKDEFKIKDYTDV